MQDLDVHTNVVIVSNVVFVGSVVVVVSSRRPFFCLSENRNKEVVLIWSLLSCFIMIDLYPKISTNTKQVNSFYT